MPGWKATGRRVTATGGGCCTRSARSSSRPSPTRRCRRAGSPAGSPPGRPCGPGWIPAAPALRPAPNRVRRTAAANGDPRSAWAAYALDAELMCIRQEESQCWTAPAGLTFRDLLRGAGDRKPTRDDLTYHLSTLFPPVRPQGHLELRVIDAQPGEGWIVPAAVVSALLDDPIAAEAAMAAAEAVWQDRTPPPRAGTIDGPAGPW